MYKPSIYHKEENYNEGVMNKIYKYLYHGSLYKYETLKPMGIDMGNAFQKPGWSLFTYSKKDYCIGWCVFRLVQGICYKYDIKCSITVAMKGHGAVVLQNTYNEILDILPSIPHQYKEFYVYTIKVTDDMILGLGHSSNTPNCITIRSSEIKPLKIEKMELTDKILNEHTTVVSESILNDKKFFNKNIIGVGNRISTPFMTNDNMYNGIYQKQIITDIKNGKLIPGDDDNLQKYISNNQIEFYHPTISDRIHFRV